MSAGQEIDSPIRENRTLLPAPLPPDEARGTLAAAAGVSTVGLRPPFDTPAAAFSSRLSRRSHLDCRARLCPAQTESSLWRCWNSASNAISESPPQTRNRRARCWTACASKFSKRLKHGGMMWELHMARGGSWRKIGEFESVTAAASQIIEIEGDLPGGCIFFRILIETLGGANERTAFNYLEHTGRNADNSHVVKRRMH